MKRLGASLFIMVITVGSSAAPARAAGELGLSVDGVTWAPSINTPLFDSSMTWVPGDSETVMFYLRNQGGSAGNLTVDVIGSKAGDLLDSGDLHITATGGGGDWAVVSQSGQHRLLTAPNIADGSVTPITVNATFDTSSLNLTELTSANVRFLVTLSQASAVGGDGDGLLPDTGAPDLRMYVALSAILLGTGLGFVTRRNQPQREVNHV